MSIWVLPSVIVVVGAFPVMILISRLAAEVAGFAAAVREVSALRPALVEIRDEGRIARAHVQQLRRSSFPR